MVVHSVEVKILQETEAAWAVGALINVLAQVNFQMFHVVAFLRISRRAEFTLEGFLKAKVKRVESLTIIEEGSTCYLLGVRSLMTISSPS